MPGASVSGQVVKNQVFIGCPWKVVRPKYIRISQKLEHKFPISFVIIGREPEHNAQELLELIKRKLLSSSAAIFDVTGGNANVSLEFGIAHASEVSSALYISMRKSGIIGASGTIISDLAGQVRKTYKTEAGLLRLLTEFCGNHNFTKLFEKSLKRVTKSFTKGRKRQMRTLALRIFHELDSKVRYRREDLVQTLRAADYSESDIERLLDRFKQDRLLQVTAGRYSEVMLV